MERAAGRPAIPHLLTPRTLLVWIVDTLLAHFVNGFFAGLWRLDLVSHNNASLNLIVDIEQLPCGHRVPVIDRFGNAIGDM